MVKCKKKNCCSKLGFISLTFIGCAHMILSVMILHPGVVEEEVKIDLVTGLTDTFNQNDINGLMYETPDNTLPAVNGNVLESL